MFLSLAALAVVFGRLGQVVERSQRLDPLVQVHASSTADDPSTKIGAVVCSSSRSNKPK